MNTKGLGRLAAAAAIVLAALLVVSALSLRRPANPCSLSREPALLNDVPEASGLAVSRRHPGFFWTHNDSGHSPDVFGFDANGTVHARVRLPVSNFDWEDISTSPCPAGDCLYIGDIGDDDLVRKNVHLYRLPEPDLRDARAGRPDVFTLVYPDGPHNAEAAFIGGGHLFIITKDLSGVVYRSTMRVDDKPGGSQVLMQRMGELALGGVSDAETSSDGASVAVRTSDEVVVYRTADVVRGGNIEPAMRLSVGELREPDGEGVALGEKGVVYLTSEGRPWKRAGRFISLRCDLSERPT